MARFAPTILARRAGMLRVRPSESMAICIGCHSVLRFAKTGCRNGQNCPSGGTPSARIGSADGLGRGWPARGTLPRHTSQGRDRKVRAMDGFGWPPAGSLPLLPLLARDRAEFADVRPSAEDGRLLWARQPIQRRGLHVQGAAPLRRAAVPTVRSRRRHLASRHSWRKCLKCRTKTADRDTRSSHGGRYGRLDLPPMGALADGPEPDESADFGSALVPGRRAFRPSGLFVANGGSECTKGPCCAAGSATSCGEAGCPSPCRSRPRLSLGFPRVPFSFLRASAGGLEWNAVRRSEAFAQVRDLRRWSG